MSTLTVEDFRIMLTSIVTFVMAITAKQTAEHIFFYYFGHENKFEPIPNLIFMACVFVGGFVAISILLSESNNKRSIIEKSRN